MSRTWTEDDAGQRLIQALARVRAKVRLLLVLDGLGLLAFWLTASFAVMAFLDWWVHFPGYIRTVALGTAAIITSWYVYRRVVRPALAPISLEQIALSLGRLTPEANERLASAVEYIEHKADGSDELWSKVLANASASARDMPLGRALHPARALRSAVLGAVLLAMAIGFRIAAPETSQIAWSRMLLPLGQVDWPRSVQIVPITRDVLVAHGESFTVRMRIARGDEPGLRAYVEAAPVGSSAPRQLMHPDSEGVFRFVIENIRVPMEYTFFAGDDDTRERPFRIGVVARPEVTSGQVRIIPPAYAAGGSVVDRPLGDDPIAAVKGSRIRLEVVCNKDLGDVRVSHPNQLVFEDGAGIPLTRIDSQTSWFAEFEAVDSTTFEIRLTDEHGFETRAGRRYSLAVQQDQPPRISVVEPPDEIEITPQGSLRLAAHAVDDFGLTACRLLAGRSAETLTPIADFPMDDAGMAPTTSREFQYDWSMSTVQPPVQPGDRIEYAVEVRDNFRLDGQSHEPLRSALRRLRIVTSEELAEILRQSLVGLRGSLRQMAGGIDSVREQTDSLDQNPRKGTALTDSQRDQAFRLARELQRLREASDTVIDRFDEIIQRAAENQAAQLDVALQARRLGRRLAAAGDALSVAASESLAESGRASDAGEQHRHLSSSLAHQDALLAALAETLGELDRWNDYQDLVRQTRELLDREETMMRDGARLAGRLAGRAAEELTTTERTDLDRLELSQREIADESRSLIDAMIRTASGLTLTDLAAADALQRAAETAHAQGLTPSLLEASEHLHENRIHRATECQDRACATIRAMLAAFDEKPERELATLSRETRELTEQIEKLIKMQSQLMDRCKVAAAGQSEEHDLAELGDRQTSMAKTTMRLAQKASTREHESQAARDELVGAAGHMDTAAGHLDELDASAALPPQERALESLQNALALLKDLNHQTEQLLAERSLEAIRRQLAALRETQTQLRTQTVEIAARDVQSTDWSRADRVRISRLAQHQAELAQPFEEIITRLSASPVYAHVVQAAADDAAAAAELLKNVKPADALSRQAYVIQRLSWLIAAIDERPARSGNRFVSSEASGGGASAPTMEKPVPALAELKVLKLLQLDLNERTRVADSDMTVEGAENRAQAAETLAQTQSDIHALSVRMIEQAARGGGQ